MCISTHIHSSSPGKLFSFCTFERRQKIIPFFKWRMFFVHFTYTHIVINENEVAWKQDEYIFYGSMCSLRAPFQPLRLYLHSLSLRNDFISSSEQRGLLFDEFSIFERKDIHILCYNGKFWCTFLMKSLVCSRFLLLQKHFSTNSITIAIKVKESKRDENSFFEK